MNPDELPISPRENTNPLFKLFFCWIIPLFRLGYKRDLEITDLYRVLPEDKSSTLGDQLATAWHEQIIKCEKYNKAHKNRKEKVPSLLKALFKVFGFDYCLLGIICFSEEVIYKIAQPLCLGYLIRYFGGEFELYQGYLFAGGVVLASALYTTQQHPFFFAVQHKGMQMRVACSSLVFRKAMRLSQESLGQTTVGQMVNFLANDVNRFDMSTGFFHYLWVGPIQLTVVIYILWGYFGAPCLVGVALLVLFVPFQSQMGRLFGNLRLVIAGKTDHRIRVMNEIVSAMRVIKMYTWEIPFAKLVGIAREEEIREIKKTATLKSINLSMYYISSKLVIFLTLLTYVLTGNYLNAEKVFVTLSLYNNVRLIMTLFFPNGISQLAEVLVSIKRLQNFLLMEERKTLPLLIPPFQREKISKSQHGVKLTNLCAKWNGESEEMTLSNVSFEVKRGQLVAIIGPVGSGKGSLLQAILRELPTSTGDIRVTGRLAYASQEPWVYGGSIKENILFGAAFEPSWYDKVLEACALKRDLSLLPFGDNTLVGERGNALSGGQKARVNLARAVYANADIYLMDDPLSAVDAQVGRHLFDKCVMGILKNKARILVTHQLQFLKPADEIILLVDGSVQAQGTYTELLKTGINFAQLLKSEDHPPAGRHRNALERSSSFTQKTDVEFRRSASMSLLEMGILGQGESLVPEEFDGEEPVIARSHGHGILDQSSGLLFPPLKKKRYGTFYRSDGSLTVTQEEAGLVKEEPRLAEEMKSTGDIGWGIYWNYIRSGSNCCTFIVLIVSNILTQVLFTGSDYWLQLWTKWEEARTPANDNFNTTTNEAKNVTEEPWFEPEPNQLTLTFDLANDRDLQIYIYSGIIGALFVVSLIRTANFFNICMSSSVNLHRRLFQGVLRAPMSFFENNPVGRVLNRFAKDIGIIDETLPPTVFDTMEVCLQVLGIVSIVSLVNPYLLIPSLFLGVVFHFIRGFYLKTARSVKRLEGIARSPVFSHLSNSLYGLTTIRAFKAEDQFIQQFDTHQDLHSASWYLFLATARWLGIFVDWVSVFYIATVTFSFMFFRSEGAAVGLAVSSAMALTGLFQWGVRQSAEAENQMVSVERVLEYSAIVPEPPLESAPGRKPKKGWPSKGEIIFSKVSLKYNDEALVLKDITCRIKASEKVGIVGRTGAGKSSLITILFRIAEPCTGLIDIDGVNVLKIGLHDLRSKISIIPQDPVLFIGTLRRNLNPFGDYSDDEIWQVLHEVHLAQAIKDLPSGLDTQIAEGGSNFSVGQRQLICLGRAILRQNKILVLDEATANVDPETDALIQKTIRTKFAKCSVLTVAHRLHTVMDSDRILVLDAGQIVEFDEPYKLLMNKKSTLNKLVQQTGKGAAANLLEIAKTTHEQKQAEQRNSVSSIAELSESEAEFEPDIEDDNHELLNST